MTGRLSGRVVAITREGSGEDPLAACLAREGARVRSWPTLSFEGPTDPGALDEALGRLDDFDWVVLTSPRAAAAVGRGVTQPRATRVAVVGEATARTVRELGWPVHLVGEGPGAEALVHSMDADGSLAGARVLFLAGSMARPALEEGLAAAGATVERVEAYRTEVTSPDVAAVRADLAGGVAAVLFASPSAVRGVADALGGRLAPTLDNAVAVAIGPTTAAELERVGVPRVTVAVEASLEGLVEACVQALEERAE